MNWNMIAWLFFALGAASCLAIVVLGCYLAARRRKVGDQ